VNDTPSQPSARPQHCAVSSGVVELEQRELDGVAMPHRPPLNMSRPPSTTRPIIVVAVTLFSVFQRRERPPAVPPA